MKKENTIRIEVKNVSKIFKRNTTKRASALFRVLNAFKKNKEVSKNSFFALKNINFTANSGEKIGIIGRNGSGKSTLLRIIAGIFQSNSGSIKINGESVYLTAFDSGINPSLTMRDNIYLVGALMGLTKKEIDYRFKEIVDFSGLKEYVDAKVHSFSSGMLARLAFSSSFFCLKHKNPDILLLDEIGLSSGGGDIDFKKKTESKIDELIHSGATVILVSHNLGEIEKYASKVLWLEKGELKAFGKPARVVSLYRKSTKKK